MERTRRPAGPLGSRRGRRDTAGVVPALVAVAVAIVVYALLPETLLFLPRLVIPALELVLLITAAVGYHGRRKGSHWARYASIGLAFVVIATNLAALGSLVGHIGSKVSGTSMLLGAMQVWLTNMIGFALLYWEIDRGGPVVRSTVLRSEVPMADFRFSQDENRDTVGEVEEGSSENGWMPEFVDYFYVSLTNSSAFSPTDTMPLSTRAKLLMGLEATSALLISLLVVAWAVGSMGS